MKKFTALFTAMLLCGYMVGCGGADEDVSTPTSTPSTPTTGGEEAPAEGGEEAPAEGGEEAPAEGGEEAAPAEETSAEEAAPEAGSETS